MVDRVLAACVACFPAWENDCSGFARAVGAALAVELEGLADQLVDVIRGGGAWTPLADDNAATAAANAGRFVIGGLKGAEQQHPDLHGHVVVIIASAAAQGDWPIAYWGSLGGTPGAARSINWAWTHADLPKVSFAAHDLPPV